MTIKVCVVCGTDFDARGNANTCSPKCRQIKKSQYQAAYRQANKATLDEYIKNWKNANRHKVRQYNKAWASRNPEKKQEIARRAHEKKVSQDGYHAYHALEQRKYRARHAEDLKERRKIRYRAEPDKYRSRMLQQRRADPDRALEIGRKAYRKRKSREHQAATLRALQDMRNGGLL